MIPEKFTALRTGLLPRIALGLVVVVLLTLLLPKGTTVTFDYQVGSIWTYDDVIAPFAFPVYRDPEIYDQERQEAIRNTIKSYDRVDSVARDVSRATHSVFEYIGSICERELALRGDPGIAAAARDRTDSLRKALLGDLPPFPLQSADWTRLIALYDGTRRNPASGYNRFRRILSDEIALILKTGYLQDPKDRFVRLTLALLEGKQERIKPVSQFLDRNDCGPRIARAVLAQFPGRDSLAETAVKLALYLVRPNILMNQERTQIALDWNTDRVPRTSGLVKENERIVSKHDRVTPEIKARLDSYQRAKAERGGKLNEVLLTIGKAGHVMLILLLLVVYLHQFRKRIFADNTKLLAISILILFEAFLAYLSFTLSSAIPLKYLILVPTASMILAILFDSRVALNATLVIALLVGAVRGNDYAIILASLAAGAISVYTVRDIKYRTQIFRSLAFILLAYLAAVVVLGLQRYEETDLMLSESLCALGNALLSPVLTFGLLVLFERVFGITTDLTLLELSDFNHPLLRELSAKAPGTFHHSIVMGTLAEAAAKAVNANPTLARVGAYYHDIGKIAEPEFFVENQLGADNVHEELDPHESAKHIINHVLFGIELAREHNIPPQIIEFIPAHHGRSIIAYFYDKERKQNPDIRREDFQYPGPKPRSKETGIVMLADSIEAAARAIEEPTIETIEKLIDATIEKRIETGEFDECDLTLKDIREIKGAFLGILTGIHHSRIKYPTSEEEEAARMNAERTAKLLRLPAAVDALASRIRQIDAK